MNLFDLSGTRIVITGAGGGIGAATARLCATLGASVLLSDLEAPNAVASDIGDAAEALALDVTDRAAVERFAGDVGAIDGLIDCAAICPFDNWDDDGWDDVAARVWQINLGGPINVVRAFMPAMIQRKAGRIALVGSVAGKIGGVRATPHYVMSKGGIHGFVRWAAKQGAPHNVTVNAVAPGVIATAMTASQDIDAGALPMGRKGEAHEIAGPLTFLVSPAASYVNGAVLDANGALHFS